MHAAPRQHTRDLSHWYIKPTCHLFVHTSQCSDAPEQWSVGIRLLQHGRGHEPQQHCALGWQALVAHDHVEHQLQAVAVLLGRE